MAGLLPPALREHDGAVGTYSWVAAVIVTLVTLGDVLQLRALGQISQASRPLPALAPNLGGRLREVGAEEEVPSEAVVAGSRGDISTTALEHSADGRTAS
jgi:P-type Cu+ transporter